MIEHVFIEDIIYCPSQIYYYFQDDEGYLRVAYIRQRGGPLTFELVEVDGNTGDWIWDVNNRVKFSREYDINGQPDKESEEKEIIELENEVLWYLRQRYPKVKFPDQPRRQKK